MGAALPIIAVAGSAIGAIGQIQQGNEDHRTAMLNAAFSDLAAGDARVRGAVEAGRYRGMATRMIAQQRVAAGVSGVEGKSVEDIMTDTALMGERDAETVANNAAREAWGYKVQAADLRRGGDAAASRGALSAGGTLLGGFAQGLSMYANDEYSQGRNPWRRR